MTHLIQNLQQKKLQTMYKKQGVKYLGLFGSSARGEANPESDVDLLIDFNQTKSLFDLAKIKIKLQDTLGKKVDLAIRGHLKKMLQPYIFRDLITVYEEN
jgi:predicted nucleotidyltransferase